MVRIQRVHGELSAILGDSVSVGNVAVLKAASPLPVKFQLIQNSKIINESEERYDFEYSPEREPGNYRLTARIRLRNQWIPWIYANPIYIY